VNARTADVVIIGGGLHGCSAALHLAVAGVRAIVIEKNYVGRHASGVNAGGVRTLSRHEAEIPLALSACDEALRAAKYDRIASQRFAAGSVAQNSYVAIAYTNRAIVHMLAKDTEAAKKDMAHAQSLAPSAEFVSKNLLAMQTSASKIAQLSVAPTR